jgi:MoxR-like ATPase
MYMSDIETDSQANPAPNKNIEQASQLLATVKSEIQKVLIGQDDVIEHVLVALVAQGHILIEGVPGLGKTLLVRALAHCFNGNFSRVQFTPDLMPSDITGHAMFNMSTQEFEIRNGPAFTNLLLADEINRAPAKTQAALLEVMQEGQITIEGESFTTMQPFMVLATQNPVEQEGTYPLPEAELDRFMLKVEIDYPEEHDELNMLRAISQGKNPSGFDLEDLKQVLKPEHISSIRKISQQITVDEEVLSYINTLARKTRNWGGIARGAGPRATIALLAASRALALLRNNSYVSPDDIKEVYLPALRHRILLSAELEIEGVKPDQVLADILEKTDAPRK